MKKFLFRTSQLIALILSLSLLLTACSFADMFDSGSSAKKSSSSKKSGDDDECDCGGYISHGQCTDCDTITDPYDALAYYVVQNGSYDDDTNEYYIIVRDNYEGIERFYIIKSNKEATSLSFQLYSVYKDDVETEIVSTLDLKKNSTMQDVVIYYASSQGYTQSAKGKINISTFNGENSSLTNYTTERVPESLSSSFKKVFVANIGILIAGIEENVLKCIDIEVDIKSLGFKNFY